MFPPSSIARPRVILAGAALLFLTSNAAAQKQESGFLDRLDHPDRTLAFPLSNKNFGRTAAFKDKQAYTRPFALGGAAKYSGPGTFHTTAYESTTFKPKAFALKEDNGPGQKSFAQTNKLFDTHSVDVRDARDANKSLSVHAFDTHDPYIVRGKRQDTYDEMLKKKKMSIEEVRELLNKNK